MCLALLGPAEGFYEEENYGTWYWRVWGLWLGFLSLGTSCFLTSSFAPPSGKVLEYSFEGF